MHRLQRTREIEHCIQACKECHEICVETADHSLRRTGEQSHAEHQRLLLDCAEICKISQNSMLRSSALSIQFCIACADACDRCAEDCERFVGDEQMQACARECRACADACRRMVQQASPRVVTPRGFAT